MARVVDGRLAAVAALGEIAAYPEQLQCGCALACKLLRAGDLFSAALVAEVMALALEARALGAPATQGEEGAAVLKEREGQA